VIYLVRAELYVNIVEVIVIVHGQKNG